MPAEHLTERVQDATTAVKALVPLVEAISALFATPGGIIAAIVVFAWLLSKFRSLPLLQHFSERKSVRQASMEKYLQEPERGDPVCLKVLREIRDTDMFRTATGIYAEKRRREALVVLHDDLSGIVTWRMIRRADPFLELDENDKFQVRPFTLVERFEFAFNTGVMYFGFGTAAVLFVGALLYPGLTSKDGLILLSAVLGLMALGIYSAVQNFPRRNALSIKDGLAKLDLG